MTIILKRILVVIVNWCLSRHFFLLNLLVPVALIVLEHSYIVVVAIPVSVAVFVAQDICVCAIPGVCVGSICAIIVVSVGFGSLESIVKF